MMFGFVCVCECRCVLCVCVSVSVSVSVSVCVMPAGSCRWTRQRSNTLNEVKENKHGFSV
jgi:hypothetical protein